MQKFCVYLCITVRLVNGSTKYEGRVEVYYNGEWGTVCDDEWDFNDAQVVCRQLGFGPAIIARYNAFYGQGSGHVWLRNLNCDGTELTVGDCSHNGWGVQNCGNRRDAGVQCAVSNGTYIQYVRTLCTYVYGPITYVYILIFNCDWI